MATFIAADHAPGFNFTLAGWALSTGSSPARIIDITSPAQRAITRQTTASSMLFYNTTAFTAPLIRASFVVAGGYANISGLKGVCFITGASGNGYACVHNGGNPGTIEIYKITASVTAALPLHSIAATTAVIDDEFEFDFDPVAFSFIARQNGVEKTTFTPDVADRIVDCVYAGIFSYNASNFANVISFESQSVGGSVVSLTDPLVMGDPLTLVATGFSTITSISGSGLNATGLIFSAGTTTGSWPAISESITPTEYLPATGVTITVSDGSNPTTIIRDIDLDEGWAAAEFGTQIDEPDYLLTDVPIESGNHAYYETTQPGVGTVTIYPDGSVYTDAGGVVTLFLHKMGDPLVEYNVTAPVGGGGGVAPTMTPTASATVSVGDTVVGTYAASAGTAPIDYTLNNTDAALFAVNSSTAAVTFSPAAGTPGVYTVGVVAENAYGTATTVLTVTVDAVVGDPTIESVGTIRIGGTAAVTVSGFTGSINAGTLDGIALASADDDGIVMAALTDGVATYRPGTRDLMLTDGTDSDTVSKLVSAPSGWSSYAITGDFVQAINGAASTYLPVGWAVTDFILYPLNPSSGKTTTVGDAGVVTGNVGTQELFLVDAATGMATAFDIVTTAGAGSVGIGGSNLLRSKHLKGAYL